MDFRGRGGPPGDNKMDFRGRGAPSGDSKMEFRGRGGPPADSRMDFQGQRERLGDVGKGDYQGRGPPSGNGFQGRGGQEDNRARPGTTDKNDSGVSSNRIGQDKSGSGQGDGEVGSKDGGKQAESVGVEAPAPWGPSLRGENGGRGFVFCNVNNNDDFLCVNILEGRDQWRDKTKGFSNIVIVQQCAPHRRMDEGDSFLKR